VTLPLLVTTLIEHTPATVVTAATDVKLGPTTAISMQLTLIQTAFFGGSAPTPTDHTPATVVTLVTALSINDATNALTILTTMTSCTETNRGFTSVCDFDWIGDGNSVEKI